MMRQPDFELAVTRYAVVCAQWNELGGVFPSFDGFMAGWYCRICEAKLPVHVDKFRDSFNRGWQEASTSLAIAQREKS